MTERQWSEPDPESMTFFNLRDIQAGILPERVTTDGRTLEPVPYLAFVVTTPSGDEKKMLGFYFGVEDAEVVAATLLEAVAVAAESALEHKASLSKIDDMLEKFLGEENGK